MRQSLAAFSNMIAQGDVEIYNEFSLQHEFGIFLRSTPHHLRVQFERNVSYFFDRTDHFVKNEIDLTVFSEDKTLLDSAFEFKFPRNGKYPEEMFSFCEDIAFLEQLKEAGFKNAYFIAFVDHPLFYQGATHGIYGYFRGGRPLTGEIAGPTAHSKNKSVRISGRYVVEWTPATHGLMYTLVEVSSRQQPA